MRKSNFVLFIVGLFILSVVPLYGGSIVIDDFSSNCKLIGNWADNKGNNGEGKHFGSGGTHGGAYHYTSAHGKWARTGREKAIFTPNIKSAGKYEVIVTWRSTENRSSKVIYEVTHKNGKTKITVNQRQGSGLGKKSLGVFEFAAGTSGNAAMVSDCGRSACIDTAVFKPSSGTVSTGGTSSLDDVIGGAAGSNSGSSTGTSSSGNSGSGSYTLKKDETIKVLAYLSTYGPAELKVTIKKKGGKSVEWLSWKRNNDVDSSPLKVYGKAVAGSMKEVKPGDYSPTKQTLTYKGKKGDVIELHLSGSYGVATPILKIIGKDTTSSNSGSSSAGDSSTTTASSGNVTSATAKGVVDFSKKWTLTYKGVVTSNSSVSGERALFRRLFTGPSHSMDLWTRGGRDLFFRLANKKIFFKSAKVGKVHNPGGMSDHWLEIGGGSFKKGTKLDIKIVYNPSGNVKIYKDGKLIGDSGFDMKKKPAPISNFKFEYSKGKLEIK